jgi:purine-binding chemotaxis protein CheW
MDILAARKRAAERARSAARPDAAPAEPAAPVPQAEHVPPAPDTPEPEEPGFPPLPETEFTPDELLTGPEPDHGPAEDSVAAEVVAPSAVAAPESLQEQQSLEAEPAEREAEQPAPEHPLEMLSFLLGSEEYVIPVDQVREILTPKEITPVPHTADHLLGVCSLRGIVMPVIDLNRRLGLAASERDERSRIIVVSLGPDDQVGLFVDRVRGVVRFPPSLVRPAPETVSQGAGAEYLKGIARKDDRLYILLDVEKSVGL